MRIGFDSTTKWEAAVVKGEVETLPFCAFASELYISAVRNLCNMLIKYATASSTPLTGSTYCEAAIACVLSDPQHFKTHDV